MSFLQPLLWLAATALTAPLWLHLLRKVDVNLRQFPALRFLDDEPQPRRQPLQLRDLLLFLLRLLALLALVAAFTWPYVLTGRGGQVSESRVYIFDASLSQDAGGSFQRSKTALLEAVQGATPAMQQALIDLRAQARVLHTFSGEPAQLRALITGLEPSHQRGSMLEAMRAASDLLNQSLGERKRIIVFSDQQKNQWQENTSVAPFLRGIEVELAPPLEAKERPNFTVAEPVVQRVFLGGQPMAEALVKLQRTGPSAPVKVTVLVNGEEVMKQEATVGAGDVTLQMRLPTDPDQWMRGEVRIESADDALAGDNRAFFVLPPVKEGRIFLLGQSPYLRTALTPEIVKGRWTTRNLDPTKLDEALADIDSCDTLVIEGRYLALAPARDMILRQLSNARGVLLFVNQATPATQALLKSLDIDAEEKGGEAAAGGGPNALSAAAKPFRYVQTLHPIFRPFLTGEFGAITGVRVAPTVKLTSPSANPLAFSQEGDAVIMESSKTKGRLIVLGFGADRAQTDWVLQPSFLPFLDLSLQHVRAAGQQEFSLMPGEAHIVSRPEAGAGEHAREVVLRDGVKEIQRVAFDEAGKARLILPDAPGVYQLYLDASTEPMEMLSVNPDAREGVLVYDDMPAALAAWKVPDAKGGPVAIVESSAAEREARAKEEARSQLWWWYLVIAGGMLLSAETVHLFVRQYANRRRRGLAVR